MFPQILPSKMLRATLITLDEPSLPSLMLLLPVELHESCSCEGFSTDITWILPFGNMLGFKMNAEPKFVPETLVTFRTFYWFKTVDGHGVLLQGVECRELQWTLVTAV